VGNKGVDRGDQNKLKGIKRGLAIGDTVRNGEMRKNGKLLNREGKRVERE
jgi:hypothetical protein